MSLSRKNVNVLFGQTLCDEIAKKAYLPITPKIGETLVISREQFRYLKNRGIKIKTATW